MGFKIKTINDYAPEGGFWMRVTATCDSCAQCVQLPDTIIDTRIGVDVEVTTAPIMSSLADLATKHGWGYVWSLRDITDGGEILEEYHLATCPFCLDLRNRGLLSREQRRLYGVGLIQKILPPLPCIQGCVDCKGHGGPENDTQLKVSRDDKPTYLKKMARQAAGRSTCSRAQIGAIAVTKDGEIIATAYNGAAPGAIHCVDLDQPIVYANHDMHCIHAEHNLVELLRKIFDSVCFTVSDEGNCSSSAPEYFKEWVQGLGITPYISGPRNCCTDCSKKMYAAGLCEPVMDDLEDAD